MIRGGLAGCSRDKEMIINKDEHIQQYPKSLGLQVPSEKVFGSSKPTPVSPSQNVRLEAWRIGPVALGDGPPATPTGSYAIYVDRFNMDSVHLYKEVG